jgi:hypothetical protein
LQNTLKNPILKSMKLSKGLYSVIAVLTLMLAAQTVQAQGYWGGQDAYRFGSTGGFTQNIQSGQNGFGGNFGFNKSFDFLGCSFSLNQFIQSNFNLPTNFEEIKQAIQTRLVKYAITNFSILPQLQAALQDFQAKLGIDLRMARESCNLSSLGQEQKRVQMKDCETKWPNNNDKFQECIKGTGSAGAESLANAKRQIDMMTQSLCRSVTETARSQFCSGGGSCEVMALLPQMRLTCNGKGQVIGGETKAPTLGTGSVGNLFSAMNSLVMNAAYSPVDQARAAGRTDDEISLITRRAEALGKEGVANGPPMQLSDKRGLQILDFTGTHFAQAAGNAASGADNTLNADKIKRKMGCSKDDPLAVAKLWVRAANDLGYGLSEPQLDQAQQQALARQVLASIGTGDNLGAMQAADAAAMLKAIEIIMTCTFTNTGVDLAALEKMAQVSESERQAYMMAKSMQQSCSNTDILFDGLLDAAEAAKAKVKMVDMTTPSPEAAEGDGAGKEKLESYVAFTVENIEKARELMHKMCTASKESGKVNKALFSVDGEGSDSDWQADI